MKGYYVVLAIFAIFMTIKNVLQMRKYKSERAFVDIYSEVLNGASGVNQKLADYIQNEKKDSLKNKARVLQVYTALDEGIDPSSIIENIDLSTLLYVNGKFNKQEACHNSDVFIWFALSFAKANRLKKNKLIEKLAEKALKYDDGLANLLEYNMFKGYYNILVNKKDETSFLKRLLDGDYAGMYYEKRLIGLYKRIAACFLVFNKEQIDEFFENDLHEFASKLLGQLLLKELGLYEKYKPEEVIEEKDQKTIEEVKELEAPKKAVKKTVKKKVVKETKKTQKKKVVKEKK